MSREELNTKNLQYQGRYTYDERNVGL